MKLWHNPSFHRTLREFKRWGSDVMRLLLICILSLASQTVIATTFSSIRSAVEAIAGSAITEQDYQIANPLHGTASIYGIVLTKSEENWFGQIFVLEPTKSGEYEISVTSKKFGDYLGPRQYVEIVEAKGVNRFYIQFGASSYCCVSIQIYRFALIGNVWRVSGEDTSEPDSTNCDVNFYAGRYSANFLTGTTITTEFKKGRPSKTTKVQKMYRPYFLSDFDPNKKIERQ
jgi:hypothetical protein